MPGDFLEGEGFFLSEPQEDSRRIVPVRGTGVTPGRAGRGFVPGAFSLKMSGAGNLCLAGIWENPAKEQRENREQGHTRKPPKKMVFK